MSVARAIPPAYVCSVGSRRADGPQYVGRLIPIPNRPGWYRQEYFDSAGVLDITAEFWLLFDIAVYRPEDVVLISGATRGAGGPCALNNFWNLSTPFAGISLGNGWGRYRRLCVVLCVNISFT